MPMMRCNAPTKVAYSDTNESSKFAFDEIICNTRSVMVVVTSDGVSQAGALIHPDESGYDAPLRLLSRYSPSIPAMILSMFASDSLVI